MDHHIDAAITSGLRRRGVDVLTAAEDGSQRLDDPLLLDRATALGPVLVSQDSDLAAEAARRQRAGESFGGLVFGSHLSGSVRRSIDDLELLTTHLDPSEMTNRVEFLPLK